MHSRWNEREAEAFKSDLELRAYTSRLLGAEDDLVMHGGGNTSVKSTLKNIFGENEAILWVKGSGHDLKTIQPNGFAPCRLKVLERLGALAQLSDTDMMRELKLATVDPQAPAPSVEAILHALIPHKFVDHTHTDAVVTVSNSPRGEQWIKEIYGDQVLVLPYIMPGFILAKQVFQATQNVNWSKLKGIFLLHHGLFTFSDQAREAYENMIELVNKAENFLRVKGAWELPRQSQGAGAVDLTELAQYRKEASALFGGPLLMSFDQSPAAQGYVGWPELARFARRGPITPDHVLHTKQVPLMATGRPAADLESFAQNYRAYFADHNKGDKKILDQAPRFGLYPGKGIFCWAPNGKRLQVVQDIVAHTVKSVQMAGALGGWEALPAQDIFDLEYWELEQAKLKTGSTRPAFEGMVALVSGAASGIGRACTLDLLQKGAAVVGLDLSPSVHEVAKGPSYVGLEVDITKTEQIQRALRTAVEKFGGLDILVSNAGSFPASSPLEQISDRNWDQALDLNLHSHFRLLREATPLLKLGHRPCVILMGSKNVPAPGPGVAPYSVAKAGVTQLGRVAALELGEHGIRVNVVHPNAVFDTGIWDPQTVAKRAASYGVSVDEYKKKNVLKTEISSRDVAQLVSELAGPTFAKTTGLQATIDGGDMRVI